MPTYFIISENIFTAMIIHVNKAFKNLNGFYNINYN